MKKGAYTMLSMGLNSFGVQIDKKVRLLFFFFFLSVQKKGNFSFKKKSVPEEGGGGNFFPTEKMTTLFKN